MKYVRHVVVYMIIDPKSFLLCKLDGKLLLLELTEYEKLKPAVIRTNQENIKYLMSFETSFACRYQI